MSKQINKTVNRLNKQINKVSKQITWQSWQKLKNTDRQTMAQGRGRATLHPLAMREVSFPTAEEDGCGDWTNERTESETSYKRKQSVWYVVSAQWTRANGPTIWVISPQEKYSGTYENTTNCSVYTIQEPCDSSVATIEQRSRQAVGTREGGRIEMEWCLVSPAALLLE